MSQSKTKTVKSSLTTLSVLMTPTDLNFLGFVFGGTILKLMDNIAYICAKRHSNSDCITASFERVDFRDHIYVGELVTLSASVNYVGKTSMEIGIRVCAENLTTNDVRHTNSSYVTMVAIDKKGKPQAVPALIPETLEEKRRYKEGEKRYKERKKRQKR